MRKKSQRIYQIKGGRTKNHEIPTHVSVNQNQKKKSKFCWQIQGLLKFRSLLFLHCTYLYYLYLSFRAVEK